MTESEAIEELKNSIISYEVQNPSNITCDLTTEALDVAIQALEKQIQSKVLHSYDDSVDENWCSCPICCSGLGWYHGKHYKYCMNCGQKLDWSDGVDG